MRTWNCALVALVVAGALCAGSADAQDKKINGKKVPNGKVPNGKVLNGKVIDGKLPNGKVLNGLPPANGPVVAGEAPVGEPGLLPDALAIPSLEYNYYYPPPGVTEVPQIPAQLYLCPSPYPPPYVGYTWISYAPFQPHEWLWIHRRAYYRFHPGGGATITSIGWEYRDDH
jgi:hypothetical protein